MINSNNITFTDNKGKDHWTVAGSKYLSIEDKSGSETYKITDSKNDSVTDYSGNDTYRILDSENISVTDIKGNDKYTLKSVTLDESHIITDHAGSDTYYLKSSTAVVTDYKGTDTYKIADSKKTRVYDTSTKSGDTYKIDKITGVTTIVDYGGKDNLTISSAKRKNLVYMANFKSDGSGVDNGSLIIFDKTKSGAVIIRNYFETEESSEKTMITKTKSDGYIETIKADTTKINSYINKFVSNTDLDALSSDVASWLSNNSHRYSDVNNLLTSGSADDISNFIATFVQQ